MRVKGGQMKSIESGSYIPQSHLIPLTAHPLLAGLSPEVLRRLCQVQKIIWRPRHSVVLPESSPAEGVFIVLSGRLRIFLSDEAGQKLLVRDALPGAVLGISSVLSGEPTHITAEVVAESHLGFIAAAEFRCLVRESVDLCLRVVSSLASDMDSVYKQLRGVPRRGKSQAPHLVS
jgi:CRP-like cAMP-binding protein